jgi:hypothetical protein
MQYLIELWDMDVILRIIIYVYNQEEVVHFITWCYNLLFGVLNPSQDGDQLKEDRIWSELRIEKCHQLLTRRHTPISTHYKAHTIKSLKKKNEFPEKRKHTLNFVRSAIFMKYLDSSYFSNQYLQ